MEVKYLKSLEPEEIEQKLKSICQEIRNTVAAMIQERAMIKKEKEEMKNNIENKKKVKEDMKRQKRRKPNNLSKFLLNQTGFFRNY